MNIVSEIRKWLYRHIAMDADGNPKSWITVNGNRIPVFEGQTKKEAAKKFIERHKKSFPMDGKEIPNKPSKSPKDYLKEADGNALRAIVNFFDNELRGGYINAKAEIDGKLVPVRLGFNDWGRREFRKFWKYADLILETLPHIKEIATTGGYAGRKLEKNHQPQEAFHTYIKTLNLNGKPVRALIDFGEDKHGNIYAYSVNRRENPTFRSREADVDKRVAATKKKHGMDSLLLPSDDWVNNLHPPRNQNRVLGKIITKDSEEVHLELINIRIIPLE